MSKPDGSQSIEELIGRWRNILGRSRTGDAGGGRNGGYGLESTAGDSDLEKCLVDMLIIAAKLEFATIPPYLCALWSIKNEIAPAAESIREVVQEEMLHLALVCNLLAALGQKPELRAWAPNYPDYLPGKVHKDLRVWLQGFGNDALDAFIRIESPVSLPENVQSDKDDPELKGEGTIGQLYETILAAFRHLKPALRTDVQVTGPLSWRTIATLADVEWAIRLIQHQGEGAVIGPLDSGKEDLAHYFRFLEIRRGKRLRFDKGDRRFYWRGKLESPEHFNVPPVPEGGYQNPNAAAAALLGQFDVSYTKMLCELERAWSPPADGVTTGQSALMRAYVLMFDLGKPARALMQIERDDLKAERTPSSDMKDVDKKCYGPQFRVVPLVGAAMQEAPRFD